MASRSYHRIERERRFLLDRLPPGLDTGGFHWITTDHYLDGLRLRLRKMVGSDGRPGFYKLGQKFRSADHGAHERQMTTFYLNEPEYDQLAALLVTSPPMVKHRYPYQSEGVVFSIDVFQEALQGLLLADLELADEAELLGVGVPAWAVADVTDDPSYEGGALAHRAGGRTLG